MLEEKIYKLTLLIAQRGWIAESQIAWCRYVIEKKLGTALFYILAFSVALLTDQVLDTILFISYTTALRERMGGWHSGNAVVCQLLSLLLTTVSVCGIGTVLERLGTFDIVMANVTLSALCLAVKPIYPAKAHFSVEITKLNNKRKNRLVFLFLALQLPNAMIVPIANVYILLSMFWVMIGVIAENAIQRRSMTRIKNTVQHQKGSEAR